MKNCVHCRKDLFPFFSFYIYTFFKKIILRCVVVVFMYMCIYTMMVMSSMMISLKNTNLSINLFRWFLSWLQQFSQTLDTRSRPWSALHAPFVKLIYIFSFFSLFFFFSPIQVNFSFMSLSFYCQ